MGNTFANDLANEDFGLSLEQQIRLHLVSNHYPPVPTSMVPVCLEAIDLANSEGMYELVKLPSGVSYKGHPTAPVWAIVENYHLSPWLSQDDY